MSAALDPTKAITELQPWQVNQEKSTKTLGQFEYKDIYGRQIAEPDLANPTRSRWERPLDTVRAFQESIDRGYKRQSYYTDDPPASPSESTWGTRRDANGPSEDAANLSTMYAARGTNSTTPLSNSDNEEAFGAMGGRNALNDHLTNTGMPAMQRPRNQSYGSAPDTGYGSIDHGRSPLQNQMSYPQSQPQPSSSQAPPRNVIQLQNSAASSAPIAAASPQPSGKAGKQRKSWLGKRLSKNK